MCSWDLVDILVASEKWRLIPAAAAFETRRRGSAGRDEKRMVAISGGEVRRGRGLRQAALTDRSECVCG